LLFCIIIKKIIHAYLVWITPPSKLCSAQHRRSYTEACTLNYHLILHDYLRNLYIFAKATNILSGINKQKLNYRWRLTYFLISIQFSRQNTGISEVLNDGQDGQIWTKHTCYVSQARGVPMKTFLISPLQWHSTFKENFVQPPHLFS
jgi:hypothetical protein